MHRRQFLRSSGLAALPAMPLVLPMETRAADEQSAPPTAAVYFYGDGPRYNTADLLGKLQQLNTAEPIKPDFYGEGGAVEALEKKFQVITGKEAAIYMPSGTMANQLALAVLSGDNTKIFVQDSSHVFRDEADAAQSIHRKRLIPLAPGEAAFTLEHLQASIRQHEEGEVFKSGIGAVSIENPVRRCDGQTVPLDEIKKITDWCRQKGYGLHLDGARIHLAAAFTGIPVATWSGHFDTVYISLYKYLGALGGAMLCGNKAIINKMRHLIKVHGGAVYQNWINAAMALHQLDGLDERLNQVAERSKALFEQLNKLPGIQVKPLPGGSNIFDLQVDSRTDLPRMREKLSKQYNIFIGNRKGNDPIKLMVNETLLRQDTRQLVEAFKAACV